MESVSAPAKSMVNPLENIINKAPAMWPSTASRSTNFIPTTSHSEPKVKIVRVKPHMAAPPIHPTCSLVSRKCSFSGPITALIAMKVIALAPIPKQLALKSLFGLTSAVRVTLPGLFSELMVYAAFRSSTEIVKQFVTGHRELTNRCFDRITGWAG